MLVARTIRSKFNLGSIDIAINRPDPKLPPTGIYSAHIDGTEGVISEGVIGLWSTFNDIFRIPNCKDITIEYNGGWKRNIENKYEFYTTGEPYIAFLEYTNKSDTFILKVQEGQGIPIPLHEGRIESISLLRGWKNLTDDTQDQGLILAYVEGGSVYYKTMTPVNGINTWGITNKLDVPYENVKSISINRTNDYRVVFNGTLSDGSHFTAVSSRCWAGFAVEEHEVQASISINETKAIHVGTKHGYSSDTVLASINSVELEYVKTNQPNKIYAENIDDTTIKLVHHTKLGTSDITVLRTNLQVYDTRGRSIYLASIEHYDNYSILTCGKFNNFIGDITINYNGLGGLTLYDKTVTSFETTFTPTGLVPDMVDPPKLVKIINVNNNGGYYEK